jgi:hypothetical protein
MCNLNIIVRKNRKQTLTPFLQSVSAHSYARNDDGDGIYIGSTGQVFKSLHKMNYYKWENEIEGSNVIFSFQRLATSGKTIEYVQPFRNEEFVFMHNGVVNSFLKDKGSDSFGFFQDFISGFNKLADGSRTDKIIRTIKFLLDNVSGDWYSMILYDLIEKKLYYWKSESPNINFYRYNNMLYITTCEENKKFLNMTGKGKLREIVINSNMIYKITPTKKKIRITEIGKIEQKKYNIEYEKESEQAVIEDYTEKETTLLLNGEFCSNCGDEIIDNGTYDKHDNSIWCTSCWYDKCLQEGGEE